MLKNGPTTGMPPEAEQWRESVKQVGMFIEAYKRVTSTPKPCARKSKRLCFPYPPDAEQAQTMSTRSWQTMQGMSTEITGRTQTGAMASAQRLSGGGIIGLALPFLVNAPLPSPWGRPCKRCRYREGEGDLTQR